VLWPGPLPSRDAVGRAGTPGVRHLSPLARGGVRGWTDRVGVYGVGRATLRAAACWRDPWQSLIRTVPAADSLVLDSARGPRWGGSAPTTGVGVTAGTHPLVWDRDRPRSANILMASSRQGIGRAGRIWPRYADSSGFILETPFIAPPWHFPGLNNGEAVQAVTGPEGWPCRSMDL
jgi:hypothetical protein